MTKNTQQYNPSDCELSLQQRWQQQAIFEVKKDDTKQPFYCLSMFPYPSGRLHMGHVRNYTIGDVIARYQRMQGKNVMQPMGWDAFGLPAENAAISNNSQPAKWTYANIDYMKKQLMRLGFAYDWSRELATCKPDYYKWEQWFFTKLYEKGLVYKKMSQVNWDPVDQTVLANEQVIEGRGWRSGAIVERKEIPQWFIKITDYAQELLDNLDHLPNWPEQVKAMQRNWIGRSEGVDFKFDLEKTIASINHLEVYTTRIDTVMGVTYLAIAPEHPLALAMAKDNAKLAEFIENCKHKSTVAEADLATMEKVGMACDINAIHPLTLKPIPVWVANFVLMDYGSGAVMSVPAHDQRDFEFAQKYQLPIKQVISPVDKDAANCDISSQAYTEKGVLINSGKYNGLNFEQAFETISAQLQQQNKGKKSVNFRLRDWGVSRQRYWGAPIPILNLADGQQVPVPADKLPVLLPENVNLDGVVSPLKTDTNWQKTSYKGQEAIRETDTFDTFMESSWYYARFCCPGFDDKMLDKEKADYWLPVDQYIGGIEHAILHLLYARFFHKLMRDLGLISSDEPFKGLLCQGMVLADSYYKKDKTGAKIWVHPDDVEKQTDAKGRTIAAVEKDSNKALEYAGTIKMSKSKNNGIDPQLMIDEYGADTVRLFVMSDVPPEQSFLWSEKGVKGARRFLNRLWATVCEHIAMCQQADLDPNLDLDLETVASYDEASQQLFSLLHKTIEKVSDDVSKRYAFNTALAANRELYNALAKVDNNQSQQLMVATYALKQMLLMLAPIVPHITQALWEKLGNDTFIANAAWPLYNPKAIVQQQVELIVQVNGKLRARIQVPVDSEQQYCLELAQAHANASKFLAGKTIRKQIFVPNRLINIVAN